MNKIRVLDLFSGIGGFHLGLERAGFEVESYFSEIDKYAIQVYQNNFKKAKYVGSVTDVQGGQLPKIDAITFGSPCQDFSLAGKRQGMGGERSSLITEAIRLITECKPRFFVWENVKGTFSSNNGADFWAIIQAFANIRGYRIEWQLLNTKWFLPQNRERIYLVGYIANGGTKQIFPIKESDRHFDRMGGEKINFHNQIVKVATNNSKGFELAQSGDSINFSVPAYKTRRGRVGKGIANTLDTACNQAIIGDFRNDQGYKELNEPISPCLTARKNSATDLSTMPPIVNKIRRLTPIECERLQGFPDNWTKFGTKGKISDAQRYKMCGNAVTVDVVEAVAKQIKKVVYA